MPTYEYMCEKCDHEFEREQRITDAPVKTCPECRSRRVKKLISRTSFVLKGGGWYSDLYSSAKKGSKGDADEAPKKDSASKSDSAESKSGTKSESKSGAKSESKAESPKPSKGSSSKSGKSAA